jgi:hypothetical protein
MVVKEQKKGTRKGTTNEREECRKAKAVGRITPQLRNGEGRQGRERKKVGAGVGRHAVDGTGERERGEGEKTEKGRERQRRGADGF